MRALPVGTAPSATLPAVEQSQRKLQTKSHLVHAAHMPRVAAPSAPLQRCGARANSDTAGNPATAGLSAGQRERTSRHQHHAARSRLQEHTSRAIPPPRPALLRAAGPQSSTIEHASGAVLAQASAVAELPRSSGAATKARRGAILPPRPALLCAAGQRGHSAELPRTAPSFRKAPARPQEHASGATLPPRPALLWAASQRGHSAELP